MTERDLRSQADGPGSGSGADDHIDSDVCIDIVADLVPPQDLDRILKHIGSCRSCEEMFAAAGGDWETIRSRPAFDNWQAGSRSSGSSARPGNRRIVRGGRILRLAVPLSIAAAILVIVLARKPPAPAPDFSYWIPATGEVLKLRSANSTDADSAFWIGLSAYEKRDVRAATSLLEESKTRGGMEDLRRLHLASLLLNSGRAAEALAIMKSVETEFLPQPWRDEAGWMEYLALDTAGHSKQADARLAELSKWPGRIGDLARQRKAR